MTIKELINQYVTAHADNRWMDASELEALLTEFAEKLQEPASEDLEQVANQIVNKAIPTLAQKYKDGTYVGCIRDCFDRKEFIDLVKAGAKWQREQIMKGAVKGQVERGYCEDGISEHFEVSTYLSGRDERFKDLSDGQSVKVIIIKE